MFRFPFTNFHELNLDWILSVVKEAKAVFDNGREDIDYAVATADEAKEIAQQAAESTIPDNSISTIKIQNGAVTVDKIRDTAVTSDKIATFAVTTSKIQEGGVTLSKLASGVITRKNILDNWLFMGNNVNNVYGLFPINQRRQGVYNAGVIGVDRWQADSQLTIVANGLQVLDASQMFQIISAEKYKNLIGKTITISAIIDGVIHFGTITCPEVPESTTVYDTSDSVIKMAVYADGRSQIARIVLSAGSIISAVKVEIGATQTLAHYENNNAVLNEIPTYTEEMLKCESYYVKYGGNQRIRASFINPNFIDFFIPIPIALAGTPTIYGTPKVRNMSDVEQSDFSIAVVSVSPCYVQVRATKTAHGLTDAVICDATGAWGFEV